VQAAWIDDLRPRATALGGIRKVRGSLPTQNVSDGDFVYDLADGTVYRYSAALAAWVKPFPSVNPGLNVWPTPAFSGQIAYNNRSGYGLMPMFFDGGQWRSMGAGSLQWAAAQVLAGAGAPDSSARHPLIMQSGSHVLGPQNPTDLLGQTPVYFPRTFPHGVGSVVVTLGDDADFYAGTVNSSGAFAGYYDAGWLQPVVKNVATNGFVVSFKHAEGYDLGAVHNVRVNWIAFGW
jgi:hypothetical protein